MQLISAYNNNIRYWPIRRIELVVGVKSESCKVSDLGHNLHLGVM